MINLKEPKEKVTEEEKSLPPTFKHIA